MLVYNLIISHLEYCNALYHGLSDCLLNQLQYNLGKEVDLQNYIKVISSNFVGFNIFIKNKKYRTFSA